MMRSVPGGEVKGKGNPKSGGKMKAEIRRPKAEIRKKHRDVKELQNTRNIRMCFRVVRVFRGFSLSHLSFSDFGFRPSTFGFRIFLYGALALMALLL
jgi:hypothetical protein